MDNIDLVINFDVPHEAESYIHRIGRTWRAGQKWKAIMLVDKLELPLLKNIELVNKVTVKKSEHMAVSDKSREFAHVKLDKSTKKRGWKPQNKRKQSGWYAGKNDRRWDNSNDNQWYSRSNGRRWSNSNENQWFSRSNDRRWSNSNDSQWFSRSKNPTRKKKYGRSR